MKNLASLEYLNLYGTQVTDAGLGELEGLKNLRAIYLWQTKVTPEGVESLKKALPQCEINTGWDEKADKAKPGHNRECDRNHDRPNRCLPQRELKWPPAAASSR